MSAESLLADLRREPNSIGVLENTIDALVPNPNVKEHIKMGLRRAKLILRATPDSAGTVHAYLVHVLEGLMGLRPEDEEVEDEEGPPLRRSQGGRRGGYTDVFSSWLADLEHQPTRATIDRILAGLQGMYNDASLALHETGGHLSPPQQVVLANYEDIVGPALDELGGPSVAETRQMLEALKALLPQATGGKRRSQTKRFGSCVKAVRKTVKARKGSNPESAAIAICTTTLLHPRGRTIKRYRKGRLLTQKRR